jgi:hypothetical protein
MITKIFRDVDLKSVTCIYRLISGKQNGECSLNRLRITGSGKVFIVREIDGGSEGCSVDLDHVYRVGNNILPGGYPH